EVLGVARGLYQPHAAAVGAAVEIRALDRPRRVETLEQFLRGERHLVGRAEVVVVQRGLVHRTGRRQGEAGVGVVALMPRVGHGGGISLAEGRRRVDGIGTRRQLRTARAADTVEQQLVIPVGRKLHAESRLVAPGVDGAADIAVLGIGRRGRDVGGGRDGRPRYAQGGDGGHVAIGYGGRYRGDGPRHSEKQQDAEDEE